MRRGVVLVQADAVVAEPVHLLPHREMLLVGARRDLRLEIGARQRKRHVPPRLELVEVAVIGQQVEQEDLHVFSLYFGIGRGRPSSLIATKVKIASVTFSCTRVWKRRAQASTWIFIELRPTLSTSV